jgi:hypothetical protein
MESDLPISLPVEAPLNEVIRKDYLSAEGTIQIIGWLLVVVAFFGMWDVFSKVPKLDGNVVGELVRLAGLFFLCLMQLIAGRSLIKLKPGVHWFASACIASGFLIFTQSIAMSLVMLFLLNNKRGRFIFSSQYQAIREATPHIKLNIKFIIKHVLLAQFALLIIILMILFIQWRLSKQG